MTDLRLFDEKQAERTQQAVLKEDVQIYGVGNVTVPLDSSLPKTEERIRQRDLFDKVDQPYGSGAGAGSDFYHLYKKQREREIDRLEKMDKDHETRVKNQDFHAERNARLEAAEAATAKKRDKRKRQKEAQTQAKKRGKVENKFADDGSFLREQQKKEKEIEKEIEARKKAHQEEREAALAAGETIEEAPKADMEHYASHLSGPSKTAKEMQDQFVVHDLD